MEKCGNVAAFWIRAAGQNRVATCTEHAGDCLKLFVTLTQGANVQSTGKRMVKCGMPATGTIRRPALVRACPCTCNDGATCGGCGHAGCGNLRRAR